MQSQDRYNEYVAINPSETDLVLGAGKQGNYLKRVIITVTASATGTCSIKDGAGAVIPLTPANTPLGVYQLEIGASSLGGAWQVTTGAGASAIAVGRFSTHP